jgi:lipoprotein-releasing system ATP-binding protein
MITLANITKSLGGVSILKGVDLTIERGDLAVIMGPSGAGKTTLLHIVGTLDAPDSGTVQFEGQDISGWNAKQLARFRNKTLGFVFQFHNLLGELSALENAMLPALIAGQSHVDARKAALVHLDYLEMSHRLQHKPHELSGGEQQRVAMARALVNQPALVLADEPSGNLDTRHAEELHLLMKQLNQDKGQTFVVVTHNASLRAMGNRHLDMIDGRLVNDERVAP